MLNKRDMDEVVNIVCDLVKIPSINPPGNEKQVSNYICNLFDDENIEYRKINVDRDRDVIVAKIKGESTGESLIFTGHQDVVPISDDEIKKWKTNPFSGNVDAGKIIGRGSSDMKGGLGAAIYAAIMMRRKGIVPKKDILLVLTCDEEHYMLGSRKAINDDEIKRAKYCIVCEPTEMKICTASKGRTWAEIIVYGQTAHGSQKGLGVNAIEQCSKLIQEIKKHKFEKNINAITGETFWQPYAISAGVEPAIVPDKCSMFVDARLTLGHYPKEVWSDMEEIFDKLRDDDKNFDAEINVVEERSPWITDNKDYIVDLIHREVEKSGIIPEYDIFMGTTDGTKFKSVGITPIIFGPGNLSVVHKENEFIDIEELIKATEIYFNIMKNYR